MTPKTQSKRRFESKKEEVRFIKKIGARYGDDLELRRGINSSLGNQGQGKK